jgi:hypothetical protein
MPYTGNVLFFLSLHAALYLILLGHWLVASGMFPNATAAFVREYDDRPLRALLLGLVTYGPLFVVVLNAAKLPFAPLRAVVLVVGGVSLLIALAGTAGLAQRIGRNLCADCSRWQQCLRGGVMLGLVFITPFLGWGLLLHAGLASGFGAFLLAKPWKSVPVMRPATPPPLV